MGDYELWLGYFEGETFVWKVIKKFTTFEEAYREYKKFVEEQFKLDDEKLQDKWGSTRLDIELREKNKKINWTGLYTRKVDNKAAESEDKKDDEKKTEDSVNDLGVARVWAKAIAQETGRDVVLDEDAVEAYGINKDEDGSFVLPLILIDGFKAANEYIKEFEEEHGKGSADVYEILKQYAKEELYFFPIKIDNYQFDVSRNRKGTLDFDYTGDDDLFFWVNADRA